MKENDFQNQGEIVLKIFSRISSQSQFQCKKTIDSFYPYTAENLETVVRESKPVVMKK